MPELLSTTRPPARDFKLALPSDGRSDVYREHQQVWAALRGLQLTGELPFLFHSDGTGLIDVRVSHPLARGSISSPHTGERRLRCRLVAVTRDGSRERATSSAKLASFAIALLARNGILARDLRVADQRERRGRKVCTRTGRTLELVLPTAEVTFAACFESREAAQRCWTRGIGRGRRFGCGMLRIDLGA